jgi:hypothetical protein
MGRQRVRGTATVVSAHEVVPHSSAEGEAMLVQEVAEHLAGASTWELELDVQPPAGDAYRTQGTFRMPNRLHKLRKVFAGPPRLQAGVELPVDIDAGDPTAIEIDWKALKASGGTDQLYPRSLGPLGQVKDLLDDLQRLGGDAGPPPSCPRPTPETHPPILGVDFDTWIATIQALQRAGLSNPDEVHAYCEARGFPVGRTQVVDADWRRVTQTDNAAAEWYHWEMRRPQD